MKPSKLAWGILGTGSIASKFASDLPQSHTGTLAAVGSRSEEAARAFGEKFDVPHRHGTYQGLLDDPEVQAVYIATPHPHHARWAIKAAAAGKHILCEKPLCLHYPDAQRVAEAATRANVQLIEAFMYRCHPQTARIVELVRSGAVGQVRQIEATFAFQGPENPSSRLLDLSLGGGGILDVGCYTLSFCRLVAGAAQGIDFAEPTTLKGVGHLGPTGADLYAAAVLKFPGDIVAICSTGVGLQGGGHARVIGSKGVLKIPSPWFCGPTDGKIKLLLECSGQEPEEIVVESHQALYAYEADAMAAAVGSGKVSPPAQGSQDALGNARALDLWRREIGLRYPLEALEEQTAPPSGALHTVSGRMRYGSLAGVTDFKGAPKKISRLVLGTMLEGAIDQITHAMALFDSFYEWGGTCFDTAHVYAGGAGERLLGHWLRSRKVSDGITVLCKGAHTPHCTPDGIARQLDESMERLGVGRVDLYMMHRDDPQVPAGEFVDALNEHRRAGRIGEFGGSNWSAARLEEANLYASKHALQPFTVASNNFSLASMVQPVWENCVSSSDTGSRAWFTRNQLSLFAWSSQARGFFARADRAFTGDAELMRCWYSDENFERLARARELGQQKGVSPVVIAAAYVLAQPFPVYALVGPQNLAELRDSMHAFDVELAPEEAAWLETGRV